MLISAHSFVVATIDSAKAPIWPVVLIVVAMVIAVAFVFFLVKSGKI
ncbi:hypothetical protein ES708_11379 [subsurface metagenome]